MRDQFRFICKFQRIYHNFLFAIYLPMVFKLLNLWFLSKKHKINNKKNKNLTLLKINSFFIYLIKYRSHKRRVLLLLLQSPTTFINFKNEKKSSFSTSILIRNLIDSFSSFIFMELFFLSENCSIFGGIVFFFSTCHSITYLFYVFLWIHTQK